MYTKWPAAKLKENEFTIGYIGENNPFGKYFEDLEKKKIQKRKVKVVHYKRVEDIKGCNILFIGEDMRNLMQKINKICDENAILTFADYKEFEEDGGCVTFFDKNKQIRFRINRDVVDNKKLVIHSQLLKLAEKE